MTLLSRRFIGAFSGSAGISAAVARNNIHALMGIGGAPEGMITAAAMKCLDGEIRGRVVFDPERSSVDGDKASAGEGDNTS